MTALEIVDTAIKIGLGALVSGFASYLIMRRTQAHETDKDVRAQLTARVEEIIGRVEEFHSAFQSYVYLFAPEGDTGGMDEVIADRLRAQRKFLLSLGEGEIERKREEAGLAAREKNSRLVYSRAVLQLLGASKAVKAVDHYRWSAEEFWLLSANDGLTPKSYEAVTKKVKRQKDELYDALSELYPLRLGG